jgi:hypothetical protein
MQNMRRDPRDTGIQDDMGLLNGKRSGRSKLKLYSMEDKQRPNSQR